MLYDAVLVLALLIVAGIIALPFTGMRLQAGRDVVYTLYLAGAWFAYVGGCWVRLGQTLGMRAWKVRIVSVHGGRPDWRQAAVRFAVSLVSAACAGLGFLAALLRRDRACWHDRASATRLLREVSPQADRRRMATTASASSSDGAAAPTTEGSP